LISATEILLDPVTTLTMPLVNAIVKNIDIKNGIVK
jgi:hypothetical protein